MKIKCTNIILDGKKTNVVGVTDEILTVGKEYIVLAIYMDKLKGIGFQFECDDGELIIPNGNQFEALSGYMPSNWEIIFKNRKDGSCYLELSPQKWNKARFEGETSESYKPNFYEAIIEVNTPLENWRSYPQNQIPEVVKLYFQDKDIIYQEEEAYEKARLSGFSKPSSILLDLIKGGTSKT